MAISQFSFPTAIHFGAGARKLVGPYLLERGLKRPLIVTDRALAALPVLADFRGHLRGLNVAVFDGIFGNPTCAMVMAGAAAFKAHGADCVIGFGGGAALDVAKVVGVMATHPGDVLEYVWDHPGVWPIQHELPHFVALPTTAGTGSEVGRSSVVSENDTHHKRTVFSAKILAKAVFADPELTLALPAPVTAATGMDALTHNIESYLSPAYHPLCDGIALEGLRVGARALLQGGPDVVVAVDVDLDPAPLGRRGDAAPERVAGRRRQHRDRHACRVHAAAPVGHCVGEAVAAIEFSRGRVCHVSHRPVGVHRRRAMHRRTDGNDSQVVVVRVLVVGEHFDVNRHAALCTRGVVGRDRRAVRRS
jgi:hypothetical protein